MVNHALLFAVTLYQEIYDGTQGSMASLVSVCQIFLMIFQIGVIISLSDNSLILKETVDSRAYPGYVDLGVVPTCFSSVNTRYAVIGRSMEWCLMELIIACLYIITMILYLLKSRLMFVGINPKMRFDSFFMSLMANKIVSEIKLDITEITKSKTD